MLRRRTCHEIAHKGSQKGETTWPVISVWERGREILLKKERERVRVLKRDKDGKIVIEFDRERDRERERKVEV